jgi:DNA-binding NarL/FixJ family response regulator
MNKVFENSQFLHLTADSLLMDIVTVHDELVPVLYLTGISHWSPQATVREVSKEHNLNEAYLLALLSTVYQAEEPVEESLPCFSLMMLNELCQKISDFLLETLEEWFPPSTSTMDLSAFRVVIEQASATFKNIIMPHSLLVYELYYSPEFTSRQPDLFSFSIEYVRGNQNELKAAFQQGAFAWMTKEINSAVFSDFSRAAWLYRVALALDRIEQGLLKPLVLQMEERVVATWHKQHKDLARNTYILLETKGKETDEGLTDREKEVLQLIAAGKLNKEIAEELHVALTTVITHRKHLIEKLGIKSVSGLTVYAYTHGYLDPSLLINED